MRVLTVRQPWAWAIVHGQKDVENRSRNIAGDYRGPVAIHAGLGSDPDGWDYLYSEHRDLWGKAMPGAGNPAIAKGAIIGVVDLVDVHLSDTYAECWDPVHERSTQCSPWAMKNYHHLVLANPRPLVTPIPFKGALGLRELPADMVGQFRDQLGGAV